MARKRKLQAIPPEPAPETKAETPARSGGLWSGSAANMLRARLEATQRSLADGVLTGTVVLDLSPDQIVDAVGSDRRRDWEADDAFAALKADIARRGQTQAIRVRPADPAWRPDPADPLRTDADFVIQSGRRRLEAARQLARPVRAVVSTEEGDAALADLEERFKENTMRQALTGFEELLSIGLIAQSLPDLGQVEIAERLGVAQGDVSLGKACLDLEGEIALLVDTANTPKRAFREIIPRIRAGRNPQPGRTPSVDPRRDRIAPVTLGGRKATMRRLKRGFSVTVQGLDASEDEIREIAKRVLRLIDEP